MGHFDWGEEAVSGNFRSSDSTVTTGDIHLGGKITGELAERVTALEEHVDNLASNLTFEALNQLRMAGQMERTLTAIERITEMVLQLRNDVNELQRGK